MTTWVENTSFTLIIKALNIYNCWIKVVFRTSYISVCKKILRNSVINYFRFDTTTNHRILLYPIDILLLHWYILVCVSCFRPSYPLMLCGPPYFSPNRCLGDSVLLLVTVHAPVFIVNYYMYIRDVGKLRRRYEYLQI